MKKLAVIAAAALLSSAALAQTFTMGVSIPTATHGFMGGLNWWANEAKAHIEATYPDVEVVIIASGNVTEQANALQDLVAIHNVDALVVLPFESDPLTGPVAEVKEQGVFITVVDRGLVDETIQDLYVSGDNVAFGRAAGEYFAANLNEGDNVIVIRGIATVIDNQRVDAFNAALEGTGINVLDSRYGNWNRDDAYEVTQDMLTAYPDIDAIWASDDDMAEGVEAAVIEAGREGDLWIVGGAGKKEYIARIMDNDPLFPVNISYSPAQIATAMELTAIGLVTATPIIGTYLLSSEVITPENAESHYFPDSPF